MEQKESTVEERVIAYMNERYSDRFSDPVKIGGYAGSVYRQYLVASETLGKNVTVEVFDPNGANEHFWDNYVGLKYDGAVYEKLTVLFSEAFRLLTRSLCAIY